MEQMSRVRSLKNAKKLILVAYNWKIIRLDMPKKNDKQEKKELQNKKLFCPGPRNTSGRD